MSGRSGPDGFGRVRHSRRLGKALQRGQSLFTVLTRLLAGGLNIGPTRFRSGSLRIRHQGESADRVRIHLQQAVGGVLHLVGIAGLLVSAHKSFKGVVLHNRIRVLQQELLKRLSFSGWIRLAQRIDVGVVLSLIFDFFFLG